MLGVETEMALSDLPNNNSVKYQATEIIKTESLKSKSSNCKLELNLVKSIKEKTDKNNIIFTKADKGNTVIAIEKPHYIQKTIDFIQKGTFGTINFDPTNKFQKQVKQEIEKAASIISNNMKFKLSIMNPQPPQLYSLIKLHKTDYPIRPVVSYMSAPAYKLSNFLIDIIKNHCNFQPNYSIKNSTELISKIKKVDLPTNARLVSFDIQNLFPSIPPKDTIVLVENLLVNNRVNPVIKNDIINLLKTCLNQNYFCFNEKFYESKDGLIMGSPLSPLLAEIFLDNLETKFHSNKASNSLLYWYRYVDDILVCFTGSDRQLGTILQLLNTLHPRIKFTVEEEVESSINFLDLTITRTLNKHRFSIYHKPSHTDITIHNTSHHPVQHKLAAYHSMIHRLTNVPLSENAFQEELNIIKQIAINNGYSPLIIEKMLTKKLQTKAISEIYPNVKNKNKEQTLFKCITYFGNPSAKIKKFLSGKNIKIAFKTNNSLGKWLKNSKSKTDKNNKSGIYQLNCGTCPKTYIGQTGRSFKTRIKEHKNSFLNQKNNSNYANHILNENHTFNDNFKILHLENKGKKLNFLESLEINRLKNTGTLLNDQTDLNASPLLNLFNSQS